MKKVNSPLLLLFIILVAGFKGVNQEAEILYQSPVADAHYINPEQTIILKLATGFDPEYIENKPFRLEGSESGTVDFSTLLSDDFKTLIITPQNVFQWGEVVWVKILTGLFTRDGLPVKPLNFRFFIKPSETLSLLKMFRQQELATNLPKKSMHQKDIKPFDFPVKENNLPDDYPAPSVNFGANHTLDNEYIFMNMVSRTHQVYNDYLTILDDYGTPIYYQKVDLSSRDFQVLSSGYLAYSNNDLLNPANEKYYLLDSSYVIFDSVMMGNGYNVDGHDMLLLGNGHFLMMSYDPQLVNMSLVVPGGNPSATVIGLVIQEVDLDRQVYFQWRSWDHFQITDATYDIDLTAAVIDYVHANALELDVDGNILVSCRHLDEITKIDFQSGAVIWRFGKNSENNMFSIANDEMGFSHQHDIRRLTNNYYTVFDNGNNHNPPVSRALKYQLDEQNLVATLDWGYQREDLYAPATGSFRQLSNGKKLIGWGTHFPLNITELNSDNTLSFDLFLPDGVASYRALKFPWRTNLFTTFRELSFGNFAGYSSPKENYLYVHNQSADTVKITSVHHHLDEYELITELPFKINPGESGVMKIKFLPGHNGVFNDRFTLNCDNENNTRRIARQLDLLGVFDDNIPTVFIDPDQGSVDVDPATLIQIIFDEPVRKVGGDEILTSSIPDLVNFRQENFLGESIGFEGMINEEKTLITLIPNQLLDENQQYFVRLKDDRIEDYDGNKIENSEISYFKTGTVTTSTNQSFTEMEVVPNPFTDKIRIETTADETIMCQIFDITGHCWTTVYLTKQITEIITHHFPKGIFLVRTTTKNAQQTRKIVKY